MGNILENLKLINQADLRQKGKIKYPLNEIIGIAFFAMTAGANDFVDIAAFAHVHHKQLKQIFPQHQTTPTHDTITRAFAMLDPQYLQTFQTQFNELLNTNQGEKIKKILHIDGKTQKGNANNTQTPNHIVSIVDKHGFFLTQKLVNDKSNEIAAIPQLLDSLNIKGHTLTSDAIGTQKEIVVKIRQKQANYVLALKANQKTLYTDVNQCFADPVFLATKTLYFKTTQKARGNIELREYWQSKDISRLSTQDNWMDLRTIVMTKNTVTKPDGTVSEQTRYFISSLPLNVKEIVRVIRGHWMVESAHWHLDVTFGEDANRTLDRMAAFNLNILRKLVLNFLKIMDLSEFKGSVSLKTRRFITSCDPIKYLQQLLTL
jgi:predicted transposase YbfD/YdcC